MNSTVSDDLSRDYLASEAARQLNDINATYKNVAVLHKELLEINLSIIAYIEESKKRLSILRLELANNANSAEQVADILSKK